MSALVVKNFAGVELSITAEAHMLKDNALAAAGQITAVKDHESLEKAVAICSKLKGLIKSMEVSRVEVKAPVLKLGSQIDEMAREFKDELTQEGVRVNELVKSYHLAEQRKADAKRKFEEDMALKRREAEQKKAKEAAEEAALLAKAAESAETVQEALELQAMADESAQRAEETQERAQGIAPKAVSAPEKVQKMAVRKVWRHEVLDVRALYAARPELCKVEPKTALINAAITGGDQSIPGLRIWQEDDVTIRA